MFRAISADLRNPRRLHGRDVLRPCGRSGLCVVESHPRRIVDVVRMIFVKVIVVVVKVILIVKVIFVVNVAFEEG